MFVTKYVKLIFINTKINCFIDLEHYFIINCLYVNYFYAIV